MNSIQGVVFLLPVAISHNTAVGPDAYLFRTRYYSSQSLQE
jgi:hypothetical protein